MDMTSSRSISRRTGIQVGVYLGTLTICTVAYFTLETLQASQRSRLGVAVLIIGMWFIPMVAALTALLRARETLRLQRRDYAAAIDERNMLRTLIDSMPDFIYVKDVQCRFLLANKFCCDAMGATPDQLLGQTDFDFYAREIAQGFYEDEQKVIHSGEPLLYRQEEVTDRDGRTSTILTTKVPLRNATGRTVGVMGIGRNITARVAAERQLRAAQEAAQAEMRERERMAIELRLAQKLDSVGRLAAGLAHEINTPIQYVRDSVHFLQSAFEDLSKVFVAYRDTATRCARDAPDKATYPNLQALEASSDLDFLRIEVPRAFDRTLEGTERVVGIVRAMKEFAHPDTDEQKPADLNHALRTTLTVAHGEYRYAARIETRLGELPEIVCNVSALNQVFLNLLVNSAHAIADAGKDSATGVIHVSTRLVGDEAQVTIGDNGCGIAEQDLDKIFDPFFTTKEVGRGTGQGLAISRTIVVDRHAGRIEVSSEVGRGTQFVISLPVSGRSSKASA